MGKANGKAKKRKDAPLGVSAPVQEVKLSRFAMMPKKKMAKGQQ